VKHKLLLVGLLVSCSAHAQFTTGNRLLADMQEPVGYTRGLSLGYVMGVADAGNGVTFCLPSNVSAGQINDMVRSTLIETPAVRHLHASLIIDYVLSRAWPCARRGSGV
jgi:hypothetical protein